MLPTFSGHKRTAYLKYPIWRKPWATHIMDYEEKYRAIMLLNHLDSKAAEKIIGWENNYNPAIASLDRYYNNQPKIFAAYMIEVKALPNIIAGDYEVLVSYKSCIINKFPTKSDRIGTGGIQYGNDAVAGV